MKKVSLIFSLLLGFCYVSKAQTITIGTQVWMAENLNVDHFRNGDPIPEARTAAEWQKAGEDHEPAWCYYENDPANGKKYGKLYNGYAVNDPRGLAPTGWHVPSDEEWRILTNYLGGENVYLGGEYVAGKKMKSTSGWYANGNSTNSSGFEGLPGGCRYEVVFGFYFVGIIGTWWSSTEDGAYKAWDRSLYFDGDNVGRHCSTKGEGFSVRCLRD